MINLMTLEENKISTDFSGYPVVFMGETGDGKTDSLNRFLRSVAPEGKVPLFVMFEDRYKTIQNIMAVRVHSIPDVLAVASQLKNPKTRERFSCVVFDTADKFEEMASRYIASNKETEIIEDIGFARGKKYLSSVMGIVGEIRNLGLPVHFAVQSYKTTDFKTGAITYKCKLNEATKNQIFHDAFLVGMVSIDPKAKGNVNADRLITFKKTSEYIELKDTWGLPDKMYVSEIKGNLEKLFNAKYDKTELVDVPALEEIKNEVSFDEVKSRGMELGSILAENGYLNEAMNVLKTTIGQNEDGSAKMFDDILPTQIDLAQVVVMKLEELKTSKGI